MLGVGLPAGTTLELVCQAICQDPVYGEQVSQPQALVLTVAQVASVAVDRPPGPIPVTPGKDAYIPLRIHNLGNGLDAFSIAASSARHWNVCLVYDDNADGTHQNTEQWVINTAGLMIADGYTSCFLKVSVPADAVQGDTVTVSADSHFDVLVSTWESIVLDVPSAPTVSITSPTADAAFQTSSPTLSIGGQATGGLPIAKVLWSSDRGPSGECAGITNWAASDIPLEPGQNVITVTATDSSGRTATDTITVTFADVGAPMVTITGPTGDPSFYTESTALDISGTSSDNTGVISVSWANSAGGSGACSGTTSWSAAGIVLARGQNTITVTAVDEAGNTGTDTLRVTCAVDTASPTVQITNPTSDATYASNSPSVSLSGTASDDVAVTSVTWSSDRGSSGACAGGATWNVSSIGLAVGTNVITVTAHDASGKSGSATLTVTYTAANAPAIDITVPTAESAFSTLATEVDISGTASHDSGLSSVAWSNNRGGSGTCTGTTTWSATAIPLTPGPNVIVVTATAATGEMGSDTIVVTRTTPEVEITAPTIGAEYTTSATSLPIAGTAWDDAVVTQVAWSSDRGGSGICLGSTSWSGNVSLLPGQNVITVTATDDSTNTATDTLTVTCTAASAPIVTITGPTTGDAYSTDQVQMSISGTATSDNGFTGVTWANSQGGSGDCSGTAAWEVAAIELVPGKNLITITATDESGNTGSDTLMVTCTADVSAPTVEIVAPTSEPIYTTSGSTVSLSGTSSDDVGTTAVTWSTDQGGSGVCVGTASWGVTDISLVMGQNIITITAADASGKTGTATLTVTRTPPGAPTVAITGPTAQNTYTTSVAQIVVSGTASGDAGIASVTWASSQGGSGTCSGTSSWEVADIQLALGENVITVTATDETGQTAVDTLTVTRTAEPPTVTITGPTAQDTYTTSLTQIGISGTASSDAGIASVTWANSRGGSGTCSGNASWGTAGVELMQGENVITVTATDEAGQTAVDTLTVDCTADLSAPTVEITSPTSEPTYTTNASTVSLSGTASDDVEVTSVTWTNSQGGSGDCSGDASWSLSDVGLTVGTNVITITAHDAAGKTGSATLTVTRTPPDPPVVNITVPTVDPAYSTTAAKLSISGTASHDAGISSVAWASDRGGSGSCTGTAQWSAAEIALLPGQNVITVTATSANDDTGVDTITVTRTSPDVTITTPTGAATYSTDTTPITLSGTASDDVAVTSVTWSNDRGESGTFSGTATWTGSVPLVSGQNVITVTANDASGNKATDVLTVTYTDSEPPPPEDDKTVPTLQITSPTTELTITRNCPFVILGGVAADNVAVASLTWQNTTTDSSGACTLTGSTWTSDSIDLVEGANAIIVTARDAADNTATAGITLTYVDTTPGDAWRGLAMVSLPIIPDHTDPKPVTGFSADSWCTFLPSANDYAVYPDAETWFDPAEATPGRGFWARFETAAVPYGTIPSQDEPAVIHLVKGWNQFGTPFIAEVPWDPSVISVREPGSAAKPLAQMDNAVATYAWGWRQDAVNPSTGSYYLVYDTSLAPEPDGKLEPWRAYWIRAYKECDLIIPAP